MHFLQFWRRSKAERLHLVRSSRYAVKRRKASCGQENIQSQMTALRSFMISINLSMRVRPLQADHATLGLSSLLGARFPTCALGDKTFKPQHEI